jgi:hypothetical protein
MIILFCHSSIFDYLTSSFYCAAASDLRGEPIVHLPTFEEVKGIFMKMNESFHPRPESELEEIIDDNSTVWLDPDAMPPSSWVSSTNYDPPHSAQHRRWRPGEGSPIVLEFTTKPLSRLSGLVVNSNKTSTQDHQWSCVFHPMACNIVVC